MRPVFGNEIVGVRWLSVIAAASWWCARSWVVRGSRESTEVRHAAHEKKTIPLFEALKRTFSNQTFPDGPGGPLWSWRWAPAWDGPHRHVSTRPLHVQGRQGSRRPLIGGFGGTLATCSIFLALPLGVMVVDAPR